MDNVSHLDTESVLDMKEELYDTLMCADKTKPLEPLLEEGEDDLNSVHSRDLYERESIKSVVSFTRKDSDHQVTTHTTTPTEKYERKAELLYLLKKMGKTNYNSATSLEVLEVEYRRCKKERDNASTLDFYKSGLMFSSTLIEKGTGLIPNKMVDIEGWSDHISAQCMEGKFDEVILEIQEMYRPLENVNPLVKLSGMLAHSAITFHISKMIVRQMEKKMFRESAMSEMYPGSSGMSVQSDIGVGENKPEFTVEFPDRPKKQGKRKKLEPKISTEN
jgi:hypothetical protein